MPEEYKKHLEIADDDLATVQGGFLCNVMGLCPQFECKYCGAYFITTAAFAGISLELSMENGCGHCRENSSCKSCRYYLGGIRCAR